MFSFARGMPGVSEHRNLVCGLYRRALKGSLDWIVDRKDWRKFALGIRSQFDAHKAKSDPAEVDKLIKATQLLLWRYRHPEPYKYPTAPGGVMWDRETRVAKEICEKGFGKGVLDTY